MVGDRMDTHNWLPYLALLGLVAFVPDGAILSRAAGDTDTPNLNSNKVVAFRSPESLKVHMTLPSGKHIQGMGIPQGITVITVRSYERGRKWDLIITLSVFEIGRWLSCKFSTKGTRRWILLPYFMLLLNICRASPLYCVHWRWACITIYLEMGVNTWQWTDLPSRYDPRMGKWRNGAHECI